MTKKEARDLFGNTNKLCAALEIKPGTFYHWPDELPQSKADQMLGAWIRTTEDYGRKAIEAFVSK